MNYTYTSKGLFLICLAMGLIMLLSLQASANKLWYKGIVTKAPWVEKYRHVEVNGIKFTIMPKVNIWRYYEDSSGKFHSRTMSFESIQEGQEVSIRIQGHRVYEIFIKK
jgi:hypothetical protein